MSVSAPPRVAIVGAGPAGAFAAGCLLRARGDAEIDFFERLPTPWGLLRAGVAPDHQEIKRLEDRFHRETLARGCRFLGNVEVGTDISHAELLEHYTAVIYATGAQTDKSLGIAGEELAGSWAATDFVAWYNGHPDYRELEFDLSSRRAVVIGNGNVAADVARLLMRSTDELERTDVADHALEALRESAIEEVVVLGRRGPAQAAFTSAELRELGNLDGVDIDVRPDEIALDRVSEAWLADEGTFTARTNLSLLQEFAVRPPREGASRRIVAALPALSCCDPRRGRRCGVRGRGRPQRDRRSTSRRARCARGRSTSRPRRSIAGSSCARSVTARCRCPACRSTSAASSCPTSGAAC